MEHTIKKDAHIDEIEKVKKDFEDAKVKCEEYLNGWKRERADFLNYKKDEMEKIGQLAKYANEELILKILPILDNIYLAESHVPEELKNNNWIEGFNQIKNQLCDFLAKEGIEPMKALYEKFNPVYMDVIEEVAVRDAPHSENGWEAEESGIVVEVVQNGYKMHEKVIRPAKVKVTK
jgi:molecular chaperone GrpE